MISCDILWPCHGWQSVNLSVSRLLGCYLCSHWLVVLLRLIAGFQLEIRSPTAKFWKGQLCSHCRTLHVFKISSRSSQSSPSLDDLAPGVMLLGFIELCLQPSEQQEITTIKAFRCIQYFRKSLNIFKPIICRTNSELVIKSCPAGVQPRYWTHHFQSTASILPCV